MKRSPDWSIYEFEDNAWDDFAKSDDHVVPTQGCEVLNLSAAPCDNNKKSRHEADFGKSIYAVDNLIPVANEHNSVAKDLNFDEWPDIDTFEDIDRMFRYCDSTFGQSHADELSWLPSSSNTFEDSEASYPSVLLPSYTELDLLNDTFKQSCANPNYFPKFGDVTSTSAGCHSDSGCPENDAEVDGVSVSRQQIGSQYSSKNDIMQRWVDQKVPTSAVTTQTCSFQCISEQNNLFGYPSNSYMQNFNSHAQVDYSFPADWISHTQSTSSASTVPPAIRMEKLQEMQSNAPVLMEHCHHDSFTNNSATLKNQINSQHSIARGSVQELDGVPIAAINSMLVQQNPLLTSVSSDDISAEEAEDVGFRQLWHVMDQLDVTTKLCIRDSLYRLARSTIQRNISYRSDCGSESLNAREILGSEAWKKCAEIDCETETNPIDRSIARLLFQRPLASSRR